MSKIYNNSDFEFPILLRKKQIAIGLNNTDFAALLGKTRSWLHYVYSGNLSRAHKLSEHNMITINKILDISYETMIMYNIQIINYKNSIRKD